MKEVKVEEKAYDFMFSLPKKRVSRPHTSLWNVYSVFSRSKDQSVSRDIETTSVENMVETLS
jgi:hypothetical protein